MAPIGSGSHWKGPLLGGPSSGGGVFENCGIHHVSDMYGKYKCYYEPFTEVVADVTALETLGWDHDDVGVTAGMTVSVGAAQNKASNFLLLNAGTNADTGPNIQLNAAVAAAVTSAPHQSVGPITSTTTLMDNRELIFATRVGYAQAPGVWAAGLGSKLLVGWCVEDAGTLNATTGAPAVTTGGGIWFNVREQGRLEFSTQRGVSAAVFTPIIPNGMFPDASSATVVGNWFEVGFHAYWIDASDDNNNGWVDAYYNGRKVASHVNSLPMSSTENYSVSICVLNGPAPSPNIDVGIDYIFTGISRQGVTRST